MAGRAISGGCSPECSPAPRPGVPEPLQDAAVPAFLGQYGFEASSGSDWCGQTPSVSLRVFKHSVIDRHEYYYFDCLLAGQPAGRDGTPARDPMSWQCAGRLKHIRQGLHDPVKREMGRNYSVHFSEFRFAHRLRPTGTTARLDAWCCQLARCINIRVLRPALVAEALRFLGIPAPSGDTVAHPLPGCASGGAVRDAPASGVVSTPAVGSRTPAAAPAAATVPGLGPTPEDAGTSDSELDDMLASLGAAESNFGLGVDPTPAAAAGNSVSSRSAAQPAPQTTPQGDTQPGFADFSSFGQALPAVGGAFVAGNGSTSNAASGGGASSGESGDSDDGRPSGRSPGMLRIGPLQTLPDGTAAPESKLKAMLRARKGLVDPQGVSGRGRVF